MGKLKDTVFNEIREDYVANEENSFLYHFLSEGRLKEKSAGISPKKRDQMIRKAAIDLMYNLGYPIAAEKRVARAKASAEDLEVDFERQKRKLVDHNLKNYEKKYDIEKIRKEAETKRQKNLSEAEEKKKNAKGRKSAHKNTALELIDAWCSQHGFIGTDEKEIPEEDCERLFKLLSNMKDSQWKIIPLRVNKTVGGGVYIVGNELLETSAVRGYCQLVIFIPKKLEIKKNEKDIFSMSVEDSGFYDVKTVFDFYDEGVGSAIDEIREMNETAPEGVPDAFMRYFLNDEEEGYFGPDFEKELTEEELKLSMKELDG